MANDTTQYGLFGVTGCPTTVIIDRYGLLAFVETGAITSKEGFTEVFDKYIGDNYVPSMGYGENAGGGEGAERPEPNSTRGLTFTCTVAQQDRKQGAAHVQPSQHTQGITGAHAMHRLPVHTVTTTRSVRWAPHTPAAAWEPRRQPAWGCGP